MLVATVLVTSMFTQAVYALDEQFKSDNDILIYDPDVGNSCESGSSAPISGGDNQEKVWNWLKAKGMTDNGAAGIMGNIEVESGFNPFRLEVTGETYATLTAYTGSNKAFGLVQWDGGRRVDVLKHLAETKTEYRQYISTTYGAEIEDYKKAPAEVNDWFINSELEFMYKEATPGGSRSTIWQKMLDSTSAEEASDIFEEIFEGSVRVAGGTHSIAAKNLYARFTGSGGGSGCGGNEVVAEGGLNEQQAKKLVMSYGENKNNDSLNTVGNAYWIIGGNGSNCVTFSRFFLNKFTGSKAPTPMGNGEDVVGNLTGVPKGNTPKVWAIFSWDNSTYGHTGVVLGIKGDTVIVGQASYGHGGSGRGDGTYGGGGAGFVQVGKLTDTGPWSGKVPTEFAYPNEVDTNKIQEYVNGNI